MDAQVLPNGRVLIAESSKQVITERDLLGNIKWQKNVGGQPTGCQRLPNGHTFVSLYSSVIEYNRDGKEVFNLQLGRGSNAIRKHRNGNIVFATDGELVEVTTQNKPVRTIPLPKEGMWVGIQDLPGDRFMVANSANGRVLEIDKTGKILWEGAVTGACGVWRLPNGHTLVASNRRVVELDRTAKVVWEMAGDGYVRPCASTLIRPMILKGLVCRDLLDGGRILEPFSPVAWVEPYLIHESASQITWGGVESLVPREQNCLDRNTKKSSESPGWQIAAYGFV